MIRSSKYHIKQLKLNSNQSGIAVVELALVTPILLLLVLITSDFTRAFYQYNTLTKSVRDAARHMSNSGVYNTTPVIGSVVAAREAEARNIAFSGDIQGGGSALLPGLTPGDFVISTSLIGGSGGFLHVRVQVNYNYNAMVPIISSMGFLPGAVDNSGLVLRASSTMRVI